uniref:Uncharacterized protein n=1 Tax=Utricularia reniformis TaxID=192314 RepID=A0A1Y0B3V5_9LAMI|nr:hypothetical protein AEK19_MT0870 [Utricularia reniformis]YP_009382265.1 hypothetical protein AEK19_MT1839 [Utricularia reniformis]ART31102.1 hypothetical protein AEK19_MT0870 [Utricularia reniformis]ART32009.1 hypothetical protein AEK19_MT1839 [Utricularia reniformis]
MIHIGRRARNQGHRTISESVLCRAAFDVRSLAATHRRLFRSWYAESPGWM